MSTTSQCYVCGSAMKTVRENAEIRIGQRSAVVELESLSCKTCGESFVTPDAMDRAQLAAAEKLRREDDLLPPSEVREIRRYFGLTQAQLEQLLGVGPKTVVRWERGTVCQSRTADQLLRMLREVPRAFEFLAARSGLDLTSRFPEPSSRQQVSHYVLPDEPQRRRNESRRVVDFAEFAAKSPQRKQMKLSRETAIPNIPIEAMR